MGRLQSKDGEITLTTKGKGRDKAMDNYEEATKKYEEERAKLKTIVSDLNKCMEEIESLERYLDTFEQ